MKTSEGHILPVQINVNTCISESRGLLMVGFIDPIIHIKKQNMTTKTQDAYFLLTDEEGYIL